MKQICEPVSPIYIPIKFHPVAQILHKSANSKDIKVLSISENWKPTFTCTLL